MNGDADDELAELFRLIPSRFDEVRTEEKVEANGEAVVDVLSEVLGLREDEASDGGGATFVDSGVRPRRALES